MTRIAVKYQVSFKNNFGEITFCILQILHKISLVCEARNKYPNGTIVPSNGPSLFSSFAKEGPE